MKIFQEKKNAEISFQLMMKYAPIIGHILRQLWWINNNTGYYYYFAGQILFA